MTTDPLARMWAAEAGQESFIRHEWHVTLANRQNCGALGIDFDPHTNKAIFVFGIVCQGGELSLARTCPHDWPNHKKWNQTVIADEKDLSLPEKLKRLEDFWIGPSLIQKARDLIAEEGYAVPAPQSKVIQLPVSKGEGKLSMQMAASMFVTAPSVGQQ